MITAPGERTDVEVLPRRTRATRLALPAGTGLLCMAGPDAGMCVCISINHQMVFLHSVFISLFEIHDLFSVTTLISFHL